jgi:pyruvate,water dikinase
LLARLKKRYVMREHCRSDLTRALYYARQWHLVLAQRFAERQWLADPRDYFLLFREEIDDVLHGRRDPSLLGSIVAARSRQLEAERQLKMPLFMRQSEVPAVLAGDVTASLDAASDRLDGLCVSRGIVEAEAVVIRDPREFQLMRKGAVLVAPATDPSWTPLFTLASGVIVEVGGMLSHASTVAREYGLPALANVRQATSRLKTGDRVRLNASSGFVQRLSSSS